MNKKQAIDDLEKEYSVKRKKTLKIREELEIATCETEKLERLAQRAIRIAQRFDRSSEKKDLEKMEEKISQNIKETERVLNESQDKKDRLDRYEIALESYRKRIELDASNA